MVQMKLYNPGLADFVSSERESLFYRNAAIFSN